MPERRLLIDLGNSRCKWVWSQRAELDVATAGEGTPPDLARALESIGSERPDAVLLSSVAGEERTAEVTAICRRILDIEPLRLKSRSEQAGVRNGYENPERLGVDRWLALLGAVHRYGKPVVVWDLGTATTLDAVSAAGLHLGGWILPGPTTMLSSLGGRTRLSVPTDLDEAPQLAPGRTTAGAIAGGIVAAQIGALERFLEVVVPQGCRSPVVVATGGAAAHFAGLRDDVRYEPRLVFQGMLQFRD